MKTPQISIIFPTFLRPDEVVWNLEYFRQSISVDYEVFVLDNSPTKISYNFLDNENYIFLNENIGTASRNIGIEKARAPYVLLLDDDSHPDPGEIERIIELLNHSSTDIAGLITEIHNPNGNREAALLPTVFHGAGVAFKTEVLKKHNLLYPEGYCFYGEEYRLTLEIYSKGYRLENSKIKITHRRSPHGRDLSKIFYYLARNNAAIWNDLVPEPYLKAVLYDSNRRYELTAEKESVSDALLDGLNSQLKTSPQAQMSINDFKKFSLIHLFEQLPDCETYVLCGTGKFTTLWGSILKQKCKDLIIADFNHAFHNKSFGEFTVLPPEEIQSLGGCFLIGHSSLIDTQKWQDFLETNKLKFHDIYQQHELKLI